MDNSLFYNHVEKNDANSTVIEQIEQLTQENPNEQIYLVTSPLGDKYNYSYEKHAIVILSPRHKLIFLDLKGDPDEFEEYYEDFIEDLSSISDKFEYKEHIGRPRKWKKELIALETFDQQTLISEILEKHKLTDELKRKSELLISLLIGSINDIEKVGVDTPETLLEKVKRNIILFDGEQTRFIYKKFNKKTVSIQGLSGTGKTELLLHKLKELYTNSDDSKIFFTCHNIALANTLKSRIPEFFNFMKVEKQIEWNKRLFVDRAWGSERDMNSGLYSYICHFYGIQFLRYSWTTNYQKIFSEALEHINTIDPGEFEYAFDYILIDERQDFPKVLFDLCEKITRHKVYVAGDVFQDIFENTNEDELEVDVILNKCYRTDPRTLMFSHAIGMGLFEENKYNWLTDKQWEGIGYTIKRNNNEICFYREPIRRFDELEVENVQSMFLDEYKGKSQVIDIIKNILNENPTATPDDIAIIMLDNNKAIYDYIDQLGYKILENFSWEINRAYDSKNKKEDTLFISNKNNVKGLEFPFVICIASRIQNTHAFRNSLYTMLTRSFIQSYLLVKDATNIDVQQAGLKIINQDKCIKAVEPSEEEKEHIRSTIVKLLQTPNISYKEFLSNIFNELKIKKKYRPKFERALVDTGIEKFDTDATVEFINVNRKYFCK